MENTKSARSYAHKHSGRSHKPHQRHQRDNSMAYQIIAESSRRLNKISRFTLFLLAFFGGGLMTVGAYFGLMLSGAVEAAPLQNLALGFGVSAGLFLVVSSNSVLFTEANVMVPANLYTTSVGNAFSRLAIFWIIALVGNMLGATFVSWLIAHAQGFSSSGAVFLKEIAQSRLQHKANGDAFSMLSLMLSGIMANWVIGFSVMFAIFNRAAMGKVLILFVASTLIVVTNFQWFPLNVAYFSLHKALGDQTSWLSLFTYDLAPVAIGNLIGAAFFVSLPLLFQSQRFKYRGNS